VFDPPLCNALLGRSDSEAVLNQLSGGVFIEPVEDGLAQTDFQHSHEIIREFLQRALLEAYGPAEIARMQRRLGDIYLERGEVDRALESYCAGGHYAGASRVVYREAQQLANAVQFVRLAGWLSLFPPEWIEQDAGLLVYQGLLQSVDGNPLAQDSFERARRLFSERGDGEGFARATIELGWLHYIRCEYADAVQLMEAAQAQEAIPLRLRARGLHYLAMAHHGADHFDLALDYARRAIEIYVKLDTPQDRAALARLYRHASQIYASVGQIQEALALNRQSYELARALNLGEWALAWMEHEWTENCLISGQIEDARKHLDGADGLLAPYRALNVSYPLFEQVSTQRARLWVEVYDFKAAQALFQQLQVGIGYWAWLYVVMPGKQAEALELARQYWQLMKTHNSPVMRAKAQTLLGLACLVSHDYAQAGQNLQEAAHGLERYGALHACLSAELYQAKVCQALGRTGETQEILRYVFGQMAQRGYLGLQNWLPEVVAELCALALRAGIEPDFVELLATRRLAAAHTAPFVALLNGPNADARGRAGRILRELSGASFRLALDKLKQCKSEPIAARLEGWLNSGWLTEMGVMRLTQALSWRQVEIFLLWINPDTHGGIERIASETVISKDTVNTHIKEIRILLDEKMGGAVSKGQRRVYERV